MILLRGYHKNTKEYKKVYNKDSFDNWDELLPEAASKFRELNKKRNRAIHFNPETDKNDKQLALDSIHLIQEIVSIQFSAFGKQPWYFIVPGEIYIKKEWENRPLIKDIFIPNTLLVGPNHKVESIFPKLKINDQFEYEDKEITDEEYSILRQSRR